MQDFLTVVLINFPDSGLEKRRSQKMDVRVGDILVMKKNHPCGENKFLVLRSGMDFKLRCTGCGHEVMKPRFQILPRIRSVERGEKQG